MALGLEPFHRDAIYYLGSRELQMIPGREARADRPVRDEDANLVTSPRKPLRDLLEIRLRSSDIRVIGRAEVQDTH